MNERGTTRLYLLIAWRHLRVGDQPPAWVVPLTLLALYLILVGLGFSLYSAQLGPESLDELTSMGLGFDALRKQSEGGVTPRQAYYGMLGVVTLFGGAMLLLGALLSRVFTLLATVISFSVMLGCMALVVVLSLMTGLEHELRDKILGQRAHILVQRPDKRPFADYLELSKEIGALDGVIGASPYLEGEIMVRSGVNRQGGILTGIIPELHATVSNLPEIIVAGKYDYLANPDDIPEPQFNFDLLSRGPRDTDSKGASTKKGKKGKKGKGKKRTKSASQGEGEASLPAGELEPTRALKPTRPILDLDLFPTASDDDDDDDDWEDPEVEIPKLRAAGDLPPAPGFRGPEPDEGAPPGASDRNERDDGGWEDPADERAAGEPEPVAPAPDVFRDIFGPADDGWEDPAVEIPKLRAAGELPAGEDPSGDADWDDASEPEGPEESPGEEAEVEAKSTARGDGIIVGSQKAQELMVDVGEDVQLITPIGRLTPAGRIPGVMSARIAGVFDADHYEYDRWLVYAPLRLTQAFLRAGDRVSGIEIKVEDVNQVGVSAKLVQEVVDRHGREELVVRDWQEINVALFSAMALEKIAVFIALLCVILVASFGILGSNLMSVLEKAKEIAILKTMGLRDNEIEKIFITEGLCLGFIGSVAGIAVGIAVCLALDRFGLPLADGMPGFEELPVAIKPLEVTLVGVSAMIIVWLSSLYPARVAARMRPVDAMRQNET
ncbi:MAG: FtsX-like permease family protein [Myxococcales bacterium]|nr:FtsX-like permease family protein [Myxococcales bacterium]